MNPDELKPDEVPARILVDLPWDTTTVVTTYIDDDLHTYSIRLSAGNAGKLAHQLLTAADAVAQEYVAVWRREQEEQREPWRLEQQQEEWRKRQEQRDSPT